jgi:hypothetical protein
MTTTLTQEENNNSAHDLSKVVIPLLRGVIYQQEKGKLWNSLIILQSRVRDYVSVLGLELILDEAEGYAFLRSKEDTPEQDYPTPRLVRRQQLSFSVSLLLALLRRKMAEFDASGNDGETRLILSRDDMVELIRVFLPDSSNESRLIDQVDSLLNKITKLGFLRRLEGQKKDYEVRRILKAFVDAQWLKLFDEQLAIYQQELEKRENSQDD